MDINSAAKYYHFWKTKCETNIIYKIGVLGIVQPDMG